MYQLKRYPLSAEAEFQSQSPFLSEVLESLEAPVTLGSSFVPIAVETPGGGRVTDKRDPLAKDLLSVKAYGKSGVKLHHLAARALSALQFAARDAGFAEPLLLPVSGYRSKQRQAELYAIAIKKHGERDASKWVARPGHSAHQSGRAVDLYLGLGNSKKNVDKQRKLLVYRWLVENAQRFGFYPYEREPWHWEYNPRVNAAVGAGAVAVALAQPATAAPGPRLLSSETTTGPGTTLYVEIDLDVPKRDPWTGIFIPQGLRARNEVDIIVFLHGFYETRIDKYWLKQRKHPVPLREAVYDSGKNVVLVAPTLGGKSEAGKLIKKGELDRFLNQVLLALPTHAKSTFATVPALGNLILASHSGGGARMAELALGQDAALSKLKECWAFDAFYGFRPLTHWTNWATKNPSKRLIAHSATDPSTLVGPKQVSRALAKKKLANVVLNTENNTHYGVLSARFKERIENALFLQNR